MPRTPRRFPPPWTVEEYEAKCFIVRDHNGQQLASAEEEVAAGEKGIHDCIQREWEWFAPECLWSIQACASNGC